MANEAATTPKVSYSIKGAIAATGFSQSKIYKLAALGKLDARKDGKRTIITAESVAAYINGLPRFESARAVAA
ncbi:MAG TPA: DNA-binding protein [Xanthobacteraceae bacterium]|nr:DNA-binding protein [Xanthobacteraceae bacterium]